MRSLAAVLAVLLLAAPLATAAQERDTVVRADSDDPQILAATAQARKALPGFWARYDSEPEVQQTASLKIAFPVKGGGSEAMWISVDSRKGDTINGRLNNTPQGDVGLSRGDAVTIDQSRIMDWSYIKNARRWGHFTSRVLIRRMPADQSAQYRTYFSDTPLEP